MNEFDIVSSKVGQAVATLIDKVIVIADEHDFDRNALVDAAADTLLQVIEISTFENYKVSENK